MIGDPAARRCRLIGTERMQRRGASSVEGVDLFFVRIPGRESWSTLGGAAALTN